MQTEADICGAFETLLGGDPIDPYPIYAAARRHAPIFWSDATNGWVVSRRDDVQAVLGDEDSFGPLTSGPGSSIIHGRTILHMSGDEHRKKVAAIAHRIRRPATLDGEMLDQIRALTTRLLDEIDLDRDVDLKPALTTPMPLQITADLMGIPEAPQFRDWYDTIVAAGASNLRGDPEVARRGTEARAALAEFLEPVIEDRRVNPADDLLSDLATMEWNGAPLPLEELQSFCSFLLSAGVETTDRALSSMLKRLIDRPDEWRTLATERSLVPAACAETLRWAPPVHGISRGALEDTTVAGQKVGAGEKVFVLLASANRDERHFDNPESFELRRFEENPRREFTPRSQIMPFGAGRHHCTGSLLALSEMTEALNQLFDRYETAAWADDRPDDVGYVLRSPAHLRVRLQPVGA